MIKRARTPSGHKSFITAAREINLHITSPIITKAEAGGEDRRTPRLAKPSGLVNVREFEVYGGYAYVVVADR